MPFETPTLPALINRTRSTSPTKRCASPMLGYCRAHTAVQPMGCTAIRTGSPTRFCRTPPTRTPSNGKPFLRLRQPRKVAQAASGSVRFTAAAGAVLDADTVLQFSDGRFFQVTKGVTTVAGNNTTTVEAVDAGILGNADAGLVMTAVQPIEGIDSTLIGYGLVGGIAQESIESLRARVVRSYRVIPHGGNQDDYVTWALELPGVTRACLGPGTVAVFFMRDDDANPIPDAGQLAEMAAYLEPLRPVTADVYVLAPVQKPVETDHVLVSPVANVTAAANQLLTFGGILWSS